MLCCRIISSVSKSLIFYVARCSSTLATGLGIFILICILIWHPPQAMLFSHITCLLRCKLGYVNSMSLSRILAFSTITTSMLLILLLIQYFHDHAEHIEVDYHFIHDLITTLKGQLVPIENQTTKIFTKGLVSSRFLLLRNKLVVHSISISFPADGDAVECFPDLLGCLD